MRAWLVLVLAMTVGQLPAAGHHSFAAHYFEEQSVSIEGDVLVFEYRNPHVWVHVLAPDDHGELQKYGAEWSNPSRLRGQGVTAETIKPGDHVIVTGSPGRKASEYKLHLKVIERPADGWQWVARSRGDRR
jgi:hypothetical protein